MRNGNHWDEELSSRLWRAKQWKEKLELEIKLQQGALEKWVAYIGALEQAQQLEGELDLSSGTPINGNAKDKTITELLIVFGFHKPQYTFTPKDAIAWLIEQQLYPDKK